MIIRTNEIDPKDFINQISNNELIIYEDVQASKIFCNYINGTWVIRPKNINQNPINLIDLATQKYYKWALMYLLSLNDNVTELLRPNTFFCFEYFPDEHPANILYEKIPKNHLILTCICKYGKKYVYDIKELKIYADLLGVETLPIIYKGRLNDKQLNAISYFLNTSENDLELIFKDSNFTEFFYKLLNPQHKNSYLKENSFQENLEKIIIRFNDDNIETTLEILNPLYERMSLRTSSDYSNVYSILLFNFMQWILTIDLDDIVIKGNNREMVYINLMCDLFNQYINKYENDIINFNFVIPLFFNSDKFRINQSLISNKETIDIINKNSKFEYILKILITSFQKYFKKEIGIINEITLEHLNNIIRKIQVKVEEQFNINYNLDNYAYKLQNLDKYNNIKWEEDNKGRVYPEVDKLFDDDNNTNKKKLDKKK